MRRVLANLLIGVTLAGAGAGCASVSKTTESGSKAIGSLLLPVSEEQQLGNQLASQVNQEEKILDNQQVQAYVDRIGQRMVQASGDRRFKYQFTVIDKPNEVNAFALPGGHIYVYSGLIRAADNEAELASVLGHEVGHVVERHAASQLGAQFGLQTLAALALGNNPGQIEQLAAGVAAQGYLMKNSRDAERQADDDGLRYTVKAGYDPRAMPAFFQKLQKIAGGDPNAIEAFFSSHPGSGERVKTTTEQIRKMGNPTGKTEIIGGFSQIKSQLGSSGSRSSGSTAPKGGTSSGSTAPRSGSSTGSSSGGSAPPPPAKKVR